MIGVKRHDRERDVLITGLGSWTGYGIGWTSVWDGLASGRPNFAAVGADFGPDPRLLAGRITDLKPFRSTFPTVRPPLPIPITRIAMVAAQTAFEAAGLTREIASGFGVMLNRNRGPAQVVVKIMKPILAKGVRKMSPLLFSQSVANAPLGSVATALNLHGPHLLSMGGGAIMNAFDAIRCGEAPGIIVGGFEELVSHLFGVDIENGLIKGVRDFDDLRLGPVMAEGGVCMVLESRASARARGVSALARLASVERGICVSGPDPDKAMSDPLRGWGQPDPEGFARLGARALANAQVNPDAIIYHASSESGVRAGTEAETRLRTHLGLEHLKAQGRVGSIKALLGEGMGMGAAANLAWAASMLANGARPLAASLDATRESGLAPLESAPIIVSHLDAQASQFVAVLTEPEYAL